MPVLVLSYLGCTNSSSSSKSTSISAIPGKTASMALRAFTTTDYLMLPCSNQTIV